MTSDQYAHLPASHKHAAEAAVREAFGTVVLEEILPLAGGLSESHVYKISVGGSSYVLKLDSPPKPDADPPLRNLSLAAAAGIAPPLFFRDEASGISISSFIDTKPVRSVLPPDQLAEELAGTIQKIHSIPFSGKAIDLSGTIEKMILEFKLTGILRGPVFDECFLYYEKIKTTYPWNQADKVFSHNDLNPNNILCDGKKIWVIDWDAASMNDPYLDLAAAANFFVNQPEPEEIFLKTYFNNVSDYQRARFFLMRQVCRIIYALLMFRLAAGSKPEDQVPDQQMDGMTMKEFGTRMASGQVSLASYEGQLLYGKALLNEAVHNMRKPVFLQSLDCLS